MRSTFVARSKALMVAEIASVKGMLELLFKRRNGAAWTHDEKAALRAHLASLGRRAPLLGVVALPGGTLLLPLIAYWLDRRKARRKRVVQAVLER